jgi:hypothetical protein
LEQEDFIKRQIDQLGRALGKILADLLGLQSHGEMAEGIRATDQALKIGLGLDTNDLILIPSEMFIQTLEKNRKMSSECFDHLAGILFTLAEEPGQSDTAKLKKKKLYERSLAIYKHLDNTSTTYSFDRHSRIEKIIKNEPI